MQAGHRHLQQRKATSGIATTPHMPVFDLQNTQPIPIVSFQSKGVVAGSSKQSGARNHRCSWTLAKSAILFSQIYTLGAPVLAKTTSPPIGPARMHNHSILIPESVPMLPNPRFGLTKAFAQTMSLIEVAGADNLSPVVPDAFEIGFSTYHLDGMCTNASDSEEPGPGHEKKRDVEDLLLVFDYGLASWPVRWTTGFPKRSPGLRPRQTEKGSNIPYGACSRVVVAENRADEGPPRPEFFHQGLRGMVVTLLRLESGNDSHDVHWGENVKRVMHQQVYSSPGRPMAVLVCPAASASVFVLPAVPELAKKAAAMKINALAVQGIPKGNGVAGQHPGVEPQPELATSHRHGMS
ncbi:hypothetical protein BKA70DRAFT_1488974 [Coprinopsis sp. MPI-PUGE-AT-0042]|nr:hypothetical protein BKA70DRAFT_1488974 [Coprinopsis sp. MPI-PUGE-AT-0042]